MTDLQVISGDSHIREPFDLWWRSIGNKFGDRTPRPVDEYKGIKGEFFFTGGHICKAIRTNTDGLDAKTADLLVRAGYEPDVRVEFQNRAGVLAEVIFPSIFSPIMQAGVADVVEAAARVYNDWLAEFCAHAPKRLIGLAAVPTYDVDYAVAELKRAKDKGLRGALINTVPPEGRPPYRDRAYDRLWAAAQDLDMPLILHIVTGRVLDPIVYAITPEEMAVASGGVFEMWNEVHAVIANDFIFGQVLDRFPTLKLLDAEYEVSWLPHFMFRIDQMQKDMGSLLTLPSLKMQASDYVKTRMWHGMTDDPFANDAIRNVGASQIMWGSDFPHVRSIGLNTQEFLKDLYSGFTPAEQAKLVGTNVAKVFGL